MGSPHQAEPQSGILFHRDQIWFQQLVCRLITKTVDLRLQCSPHSNCFSLLYIVQLSGFSKSLSTLFVVLFAHYRCNFSNNDFLKASLMIQVTTPICIFKNNIKANLNTSTHQEILTQSFMLYSRSFPGMPSSAGK